MKIIIDISEEQYELVRHGNKSYTTELELMNAVTNGALLPKGHGRLIDADKLPVCAKLIIPDETSVYIPAVPILKIVNAPTIIEADKEEE